MSEYIQVKTKMMAAHLDCLVKALGDLEPEWAKPGVIEVHQGQGDLLKTYVGSDQRGQRANVIVRRRWVGSASNDVGFAVQPDGSIASVIGDFDRGAGHYTSHWGRCGGDWLNRLTQHYAYRVAEKQAAKAGMSVSKEVQKDGSWRVVLTKASRSSSRALIGGEVWNV